MHKWISIHPPLAGRDLAFEIIPLVTLEFQSTRPSRGETLFSISLSPSAFNFNPPAPRGARPASQADMLAEDWDFNPPAPRGARPRKIQKLYVTTIISIHPPLAGRDLSHFHKKTPKKYFNPPAPRGARPPDLTQLYNCLKISIHPPLAGRDLNERRGR